MTQRNSEEWKNARRAKEKLAERFLDDPEVSLIDIGYPPEKEGDSEQHMALRIHVRERWFKRSPEDRTAFPSEIDGFPIVVMHGDYTLD